jgi:hypothetical protein
MQRVAMQEGGTGIGGAGGGTSRFARRPAAAGLREALQAWAAGRKNGETTDHQASGDGDWKSPPRRAAALDAGRALL